MTITQLPDRTPPSSHSWRLIDVIDEEMDEKGKDAARDIREKGKDAARDIREKGIARRFQPWVSKHYVLHTFNF